MSSLETTSFLLSMIHNGLYILPLEARSATRAPTHLYTSFILLFAIHSSGWEQILNAE